MANRPVFKAIENTPYVVKENIEFLYHNGFSLAQKQRSVDSLHESYRARFPDDRILEISTKSRDMIGTRLSAFNLIVNEKTDSGILLSNCFRPAKYLKEVDHIQIFF